MIELLLVLLLTLVGTAERLYSGRQWAAERQRLTAAALAQEVSPSMALAVARPAPASKPAEREPVPVQIGL